RAGAGECRSTRTAARQAAERSRRNRRWATRALHSSHCQNRMATAIITDALGCEMNLSAGQRDDMPDTVLIFANPIAGRGRGRVVARRLERDLAAAGYRVISILDRPSDVKLTAEHRRAIAAVSIGGDGTLR